jgi:hypothetical protein
MTGRRPFHGRRDDADMAAIRALPINIRHWEAARTVAADDSRPAAECV